MNFPLFVAKRLFRNNAKNARISKPAVRIATAGVAIGLAVMIVSVCVVVGFQHAVKDKVGGIGGHITVNNFMTIEMGENYPIATSDSMLNALAKIKDVKSAHSYVTAQGILKTDDDFLGVLLKGVDEKFDTTFIKASLKEGRLPKFSKTQRSNEIAVSQIIASKLRLKVGDKVFAYFVGNEVRTRRFIIVGIYETNMKRYDENLCFTDLYTTRQLNSWETDQVSGMEVTVADFAKLSQVAAEVESQVDNNIDHYGHTYMSSTILKTYPQIFAWLELLDLNIIVILSLMIAIAGFSMTSGLLILILERTNIIGTLKAMGARNANIRKTFLWFAVFIVVRGLLIGNIIGLSICLIQKHFGIVKLDAATYYLSTAPVDINWLTIIILNIATLLVSVLILIVPSYLISKISPARSIRFE